MFSVNSAIHYYKICIYNYVFQWDGTVARWIYAGESNADSLDFDLESDGETQSRTLRRSERIAARKARLAAACMRM